MACTLIEARSVLASRPALQASTSRAAASSTLRVGHRPAVLARGRHGSAHPLTAIPCQAADRPAAVTDGLEGQDLESWTASSSRLQELGLAEADADALLAKAFGWKGQGFWRKSKVKEVPSEAQVDAVLSFLQDEAGMVGDDLPKVVAAFPEVLACDVQALLRANVQELEKTWKMKGPVLTRTLLRRPDVLGYNIDCYGDCAGECNRCWVRF